MGGPVMTDDMKPRVVRVAEPRSTGEYVTCWYDHEGHTDLPRYLLVPLGDLPAPREVGETKNGNRHECAYLKINDMGARAFSPWEGELTRRVDPEPTVEEDLETLRGMYQNPRGPSVVEYKDALARIEARLTGEKDG